MNGAAPKTLKGKFFLVTAFVLLGTCVSLYFLIDRIFLGFLQSEMQKQARELAEGLEDQLFNFLDPSHVQVSADRLLRERREISRIEVYRRVGPAMQRFIGAEALELPSDTKFYQIAIQTRTMLRLQFQNNNIEYWEFVYPVQTDSGVVGLIVITLNFSQYKVLMTAVRSRTLWILVVGLIIMLVAVNLYTEITIRRPVAQIVSAMQQVKKSNFETRLVPKSRDEIGQLAEDFNRMIQALGDAQEIVRQNRILEKRVNEATSELRSRNVELYQAQDQLRRASRLATAGQVAAMLAHDLGSPLSSISGHLQLMLEDESRGSEERQRLNLLLNQVERLSDTIRSFLTNVSGWEVNFSDCDVNALLQHLIQLTAPLLTERKIKPSIRIDSAMPMIRADVNQLQQLFLNLFNNAMDAMKEGGELILNTQWKKGEADGKEDQAIIQIADTGTGMDAEQLKNLFRPFFSTKEFGKGTGLGLAICKEIVKAHGGTITVSSELGKGTVFTITIPPQNAHNLENMEKNEPAYR